MSDTTRDLLHLVSLSGAGLILLAGATLDLALVFRFQRRLSAPRLPARADLGRRPFGAPHALLALFTTLILTLPALFQKPSPPTPTETALVLGPVVYALAGLLTVALCLHLAHSTFREAFGSATCPTRRAIGKGVLYGLAAVPPVMLLSHVVAAVADRLGYEPRGQEVFDWLSDNGVSAGTRVFLMASAVFLAPLVEEVLFRGILFPALLKGRAFASAALLTGLYFALVHVHALSLLPLLALSVALSAAYASTGSLLTPVVMHALFNATSLLLYLAGTE